MAAPVYGLHGDAVGVVTIAGTLVRLRPQRIKELGPILMETAERVARASGASQLFRKVA